MDVKRFVLFKITHRITAGHRMSNIIIDKFTLFLD